MIFKRNFLKKLLLVVFFIFFWFNPFLTSFVKAEESTESATPTNGVLKEDTPEDNGQIVDVFDTDTATFSATIDDSQEASVSGIIETSTASASVNLLNLLNTDVSSSEFEFLLVNLTDEEKEEIKLDESDLAEDKEIGEVKVVISENQEQINLENNIEVLASTGQNQIKGVEGEKEIVIKTGEATALANVINIVNTNISDSEFFFEVVNILSPTESDLILSRPEKLESSVISPQNEGEDREVEISNHLEVLALTGANEEINNGGDNIITTGDASAQANVFSLVNLDFWHQDYSLLVINDLGNWTGKVRGELLPEIIEENVDRETQREENLIEEKKTILKNNIQVSALTGENQISENQGGASIQTGEARSLANVFNLVNLNISESRFFIWVVNILDNWSGDIIFAYSGEETPGENKKEDEEDEEGVDQKQPKLEISVKNNVGEFVYPGDTITFEIMVRNVGEASSYNTRLTQKLFSEAFVDFGTAEFDLRTIEAGKSGRLSFGLKLIDNGELFPGLYETKTIVKGFAPNGIEVVSNEVKTSFMIKTKKVSLLPGVKAKTEERKILGSTETINPPRRKSICPYFLLFVLTLFYLFVKLLKRKRHLN